MKRLIQTWIYRVFVRHYEEHHNADFEVCSHPACWLACRVEWPLRRWLYGDMWDVSR